MERRWRLGPQAAQDVCSEVVALAVARSFTGREELRRWSYGVARNRALKHWAASRRTIPGEVPDRPCYDDPAEALAASEGAAQLARAFGRLRQADQAVLLKVASGEPAPKDAGMANAWYVRVHRARSRYRQIIDGLAAAVGWVRLRLPRLEDPAWQGAGPLVAAVVAASAVALLGSPVAAGPGPPSTRSGTPAPPPAAAGARPPVNTLPGLAAALPGPAASEVGTPLAPGTTPLLPLPPERYRTEPDSPARPFLCVEGAANACAPKSSQAISELRRLASDALELGGP